ncbi:lipopolysaccharide assembly protein LapA domain-containing protein [Billgrantia lactosivorans]|uniref:lipopolysaccharide assembly protein LapA domain-containing protein n=1 Tax=Billgrantia lactosivorans TaxID=2185141 RepID=UPI000DABD076|nr:lipopolysaccharide assembly protein LapA domain-containing protein [Halomonas lactosivorans]
MDTLLLAVKILVTLLVAILFVQNIALVEVRFLTWSMQLPLALLLLVIYVLGMVSGKALLHLLSRLRGRGSRR